MSPSSDPSRPVVVVDIDGVVFDFNDALAHAAVELTGRPLTSFPPAEEWDFMPAWGISLDEYFALLEEAVRSKDLFTRGRPLPGSIAGWRRLREMDERPLLHVATDCGHGDTTELARAQRVRWLEAWGFDFDELTFTADKGAVAAEHLESGRRVLAIDDRPKNFDQLVEVGAHTFLADQRWNRHVETTRRVRDLAEFADVVGVLLDGSLAPVA